MQGDSTDLFGHAIPATRTCTRCKVPKPLTEFRTGKQGNRPGRMRRWNHCRDCLRAGNRNWLASPKAKRVVKANSLLKRYGMTIDEYEAMLSAQGGLCAICRQPEPAIDPRTNKARQLAVDHCHTTGKIRGLLCVLCNQGIGQFRDDPQLLQLAINYLTRAS